MKCQDVHSEHKRLDRFFDDLITNGFQLTADQRARVLSLCLFSTLSPRAFLSGRRLRNMVTAVVCRCPDEQEQCKRIFDYWFPEPLHERGDELGDADIHRQPTADTYDLAADLEQLRRGHQIRKLQRQTQFWVVLLFVTFFVAEGVRSVVRQTSPGAAAPAPTVTYLPEESDDAPASGPAEPHRPVLPDSARSPDPIEASDDRWPLISWLVHLEEKLGPLATLVVMFPMMLMALVLASSRQLMSAYARRTHIVHQEQFCQVLSGQLRDADFVRRQFFHAVQPMRQRIELPSAEMDVDKTIQATASAAGVFSPVYAKRLVSPEYVVLVDQLYDGDHLARYSGTLARCLQEAGVHVTLYYFDHDPRRVRAMGNSRAVDLSELVGSDSSRRLLMFADSDVFFDPASGRRDQWTAMLRQFSRRALLTPRDIASWGRRECLIDSELGMPVIPASEEGTVIAASVFAKRAPNRNGSTDVPMNQESPGRPQLADFLAVGAWRWISDTEPPEHQVDTLFERLDAGLSAKSQEWLRAIAVYPAIHWNLTLYLGQAMIGSSSSTEELMSCLLEIARLPWLREGYMPEWFRRRLLAGMSPATLDTVRKRLQQLFTTVTSRQPMNSALEFYSWSPIGERKIARAIERGAHSDRVFVDFMVRGQAAVADFQLPSKVARAFRMSAARRFLHDLFGHTEYEAMKISGRQLSEAVSDVAELQFAVRQTTEFSPAWSYKVISIKDSDEKYSREFEALYVLRRGPRERDIHLVDELALRCLQKRRRTAFRFSVFSSSTLVLLLTAFYSTFLETLGSWSILVALSAILAPFPMFWSVLVHPCSRTTRSYPHVPLDRITFLTAEKGPGSADRI